MTDQKEILLNFFNTYVPVGVLITFIIVVVFYLLYFLKFKNSPNSKFIKNIKNYALPIAFFSTLFASLISFIYSDYLDQAPCGLCWMQRVFVYSQLVLYLIAFIKEDIKIFTYTIWLSIIGAIISLYHEWLQLGYSELIPCPITPGLVDCAKPTFLAFGFITIPFSSFVIFLILIFLYLVVNNKVKNN